MATLARPGVSVSQEIRPSSPSILTPSLVPLLVGPCFSILSPLTSAGDLNSQASISTPASIISSTALGDTVACASDLFGVSVDGGDVILVTLPAVASGSNIPTSSIPDAIMAKVAGLRVELIDDKLRLTSKTKGAGSSIKLLSASAMVILGIAGVASDSDTAYDELFLSAFADITVTGQDAYTNRSYELPYSMMPVPSTSYTASDLVFKGADVSLYRSFLGNFTKLSTSSATGWTSYTGGASKIMNVAAAHMAPHTVTKWSLYARNGAGSTTNKVMNLGKDASVIIPLSHNEAANAGATVNKWPDPMLQHYLYAEALGSQAFKADQAQAIGAYAGTAGNAITVVFTEHATPAVEVAGTVVTIKFRDANTSGDPATTYDALKALIDGAATQLAALFHSFKLVYPTSSGALKIDPHNTTVLGAKTFYLSGGVEPVDFGATSAVVNAVVTGSIKLDGSTVPTALVTGKNLTIAVNGGKPVSIAVPAAVADLLTAINENTELGNGAGGSSGVVVQAVSNASVASRYVPGSAVNCLQLIAKPPVGATYLGGHDTTLEIGGDQDVIEALFSGYLTKTETLAAAAASSGAITATLTPGAGQDYNKLADTQLMKAVKFNSMTLKLINVILKGHAVGAATAYAAAAGGAITLKLKHTKFQPDGGSALNDVITVTYTPDTAGPATDGTDPVDHATAINTALALINADGVNSTGVASDYIAAMAAPLNTSTSAVHLVFYDKKNDGRITLVSSGTTASFKNAFEGSGATAVGAFDSVLLETKLVTLTLTDNTAVSGLPMSASSSAVTYAAPSAWSILDPDGAKISKVTYSDGVVKYWIDAELCTATSNYSREITYTRGAASHVDIAPQQYSGVVWTGGSSKLQAGDKLYDSGNVVSTVVKTENLTAAGKPSAGWGAGAVLVLATDALKNGDVLSKWYVTQENLPSTGGRSTPEVVFSDLLAKANIKHGLNRGSDGIPVSGSATLYAKYKALRLDVTAADSDPGVLVFDDVEDMADQIGPVSTDNPLAFALYLAFQNAPGISISALGVSETTANAPDGTVAAYQTALDFLEQVEVYAIAPLTQDKSVHDLLSLHVLVMSDALEKKERIGIICPKLPTEKTPVAVASAAGVTTTEVSSGIFNFNFGAGVNVPSLLDGKTDANGTAIAASVGTTLTAQQGVFLVRSGDAFRYLITKIVDANTVQVNLNYVFDEVKGPGSAGNGDAYYYTSEDMLASFPASGETCAIRVRAPAISSSTTAGKLLQCEALAEKAGGASGYKSRRLVMIQPESVGVNFGGVEVIVPGYYLGAAVAGMVGQYKASKPFTNVGINGFTRPFGSSDKFSERQMSTAAAGGVYWIVQDTPGGSLVSRHQLTTDMTSLKTQELSITKAIDKVAKRLRNALKPYIGSENVTKSLLTQIALVATSNLKASVGEDVADATLVAVLVEDGAPDTIAVDVELQPLYPVNKIKVRIVV